MTRLGKTWAVLFLAYLAATPLFTVVAIPPGNAALLWLPNAVLVVALLKTDRRWWWSLWLVALAAEIAGDAIQGLGVGPAIWWGTVNVLEATAVASVLNRFGGDQPFLRSVRSVSVFALAALAIPAATGTIGALGSTLEFGSDWRDAWQAWWFGHAIGFLVGIAIGLALFDLRSSMVTERSPLARLGYGAAVAATVLAAVLLALSERTSSAEYVAIAAGIIAAVGFGSAGAAAGSAIVAVIAIVPSVSEHGTMGIVETQAFLFVLATAILFVGAAIETQRASLAALRRSEARFRTTFEDAPIGMALSDLTSAPPGRWNEVNAALARTLGYRPADLAGTDPDLLVHPGDRQAGELDAALSAGGHAADSERRYRHADGHYLWCRVVRSIVHDPTTDEPTIAITQLEDITATKEVADQLAQAALHDPLTGLPNRLLLMDRLDQQLASLARVNGLVALFYVDLDQFKKINDLLGHDAGDRVLI
uniref:MASE1 domain-containing protein n=1 Tax=Rhabdothermincola sp. TaxID=2820405 RepID=UPI002FE2233A